MDNLAMTPKLLHDMFFLGLPVAEKVLRPIVVYLFLVVGLRLSGKRELAQLNPFDLVVLLTISNTVQNAIIGDDNSVTGGLIGAGTLLLINHVVVRYLYSHQTLQHLVEGDPDVLMEGGKIFTERLRQELIPLSELEIAAHKQGFASLEEVERGARAGRRDQLFREAADAGSEPARRAAGAAGRDPRAPREVTE